MFILKVVALCVLVAAPALASGATKGGRLEAWKGQKFEAQSEQREEQPQLTQQQQIVEQEPASQLKEEAPKQEARYEARPQVAREELAKGQIRAEQQKIEELPQQRIEQLPQQRIEQLPRQRVEYDSQQVELSEQRRLEDAQEPLTGAYEQQRELQTVQRAEGQLKSAGESAIYQQREEKTAPAGQAEPYAFSYQVEGSSRSESSDANGVVKGQYTIGGSDGPSRVVDYVADHNGFRASVNTNEFGTESKSAASVNLRTSQPLAEEITMRLEGKTKADFAAPAAPSATKGGPLVQLVQRYESVKGAAPLSLPLPVVQAPVLRVEEPQQLAIKAPAKALPAAPAAPAKTLPAAPAEELPRAAKGQRLATQQQEEELREEQAPLQQQQQELKQEAPKSAQLKAAAAAAPKSLAYASEPRAFESATAHRGVYRAPVVAAVRPVAVAPAVTVVRRDQIPLRASPLARGHAHVRGYPPSPVHGYRRQHVTVEAPAPVVAVNPRVSFYGPQAGFEDELPASFERLEN